MARNIASTSRKKPFALVRVEGLAFADGFMMMGVAFLLERSGVVVDSQ